MIRLDNEKGTFELQGNGMRLMSEMGATIFYFCMALEKDDVTCKDVWEHLKGIVDLVFSNEEMLNEAKPLYKTGTTEITINPELFKGGQES